MERKFAHQGGRKCLAVKPVALSSGRYLRSACKNSSVEASAWRSRPANVPTLFQFALKTITALLRLAVLQHCLRLRALFSFLMQIGINLAVHRNNTAFCLTFPNDVTAALTNLCEPEPFESALYVGARDVRQFRHALAQVP